MSSNLTVETPAGTVHATAHPREHDSAVFDLGGAMRGSVYVTGTHHVRHWGPVHRRPRLSRPRQRLPGGRARPP